MKRGHEQTVEENPEQVSKAVIRFSAIVTQRNNFDNYLVQHDSYAGNAWPSRSRRA